VLGTGYLVERAREAVEVNLLGALNVYDLAREFGARVVNVGLLPDWPTSYMITKKAATSFGIMYHRELGVDVRTLELANVYGPRQRLGPYFKAVPTFIAHAVRGTPLSIFGSGFGVLDCVYVDDVARALRLLGEAPGLGGAVVPFGSGLGVTVNELAARVVQLAASSSAIVHLPMRAGEPDAPPAETIRGVDLSTWLAHVNWRPTTTLDDGLLCTLAWYRAHQGDGAVADEADGGSGAAPASPRP
jgi:UDP-glucose 4-epimerase